MPGSNPAWVPDDSCDTEKGSAECRESVCPSPQWDGSRVAARDRAGTRPAQGGLQLLLARTLQGCVRVRKVVWEDRAGELPLHPPGSCHRITEWGRLEGTTMGPLVQPPCSSRLSIWNIAWDCPVRNLPVVPVNGENTGTCSLCWISSCFPSYLKCWCR